MLNQLVKYFALNRRERNGIIAIATLVMILLVIKYSIIYYYQPKPDPTLIVELDDVASKLAEQTGISTDNYNTPSPNKKDSLFYFDPNTVNYEQAVMLGFPKKTAHTLINYRNKGGKFYKAIDLKKLYGLNEDLFEKLKPFIVVKDNPTLETKYKKQEKENNFAKKEKQNITIEINSADSMQWNQLKGISFGRARMIIKYRTKLGGFYSTEQLKEVYYFTDSLYQTIKANLTVNPALIQKIKVNTVDFKTMVHHPYIKYDGTKCIFALKRNKKIIADDLKNSSCFSREQLEKVLLYLDFE